MMESTSMNTALKSLLPALLCAAGLLGPLRAAAVEVPPDVLVKTVTLEVVDLIAKDKEVKSSKAKLVSLIDAKVLPHFDFIAMTRLAVGPAWNKASAEQKKRLAEEFKSLLVHTYASALAAYSNQKFEFRPLRAKPADTDVTVNVRVLQQGAQPVAIDYSMEKSAAGWKVYDMIVGGVSLVANYRTEFANKIQQNGIDGLIHDLEIKNRSLAGA
jgi:phospholipid transport system substrate-binding protein